MNKETENKENPIEATSAPASSTAGSPQPHTQPTASYTPSDSSIPHSMPATATSDNIMDAQGGFTPGWYERFDDLRDYAPSLAKFHRPEALAKSYASLERLRGYPGIEDKRRMSNFRRNVGLPDSLEEYSLTRPEELPDELWDDGLVSEMAKTAYEYGVPKAAMEALTENYCRENKRQLQHYKQQEEQRIIQADSELQAEWGLDYEDNMTAITSVFARLGMSADVEVVPLLNNPSLRADTGFRRVLLEVARELGEAPHRAGEPREGKKEAHRIAHDPSHPLHEAYMRTSHPQHKYANEQYDRLAFGRPIS